MPERGRSPAERRSQLLACAESVAALGTYREIVPIVAGKVDHDNEVRRVLDFIIRRWTKLVPVAHASEAGAFASLGAYDDDHVVPCRVLVDRMLMNPAECEAILSEAIVLARITKDEHRRLGGIYTHHRTLYEVMLSCSIAELVAVGWQRYESVDPTITVTPGSFAGSQWVGAGRSSWGRSP